MYKLIKNPITGDLSGVYLIDTRTSIPLNDANSDYQKYLKWLAEGNEPLPADE
jgi:hypothetical protein